MKAVLLNSKLITILFLVCNFQAKICGQDFERSNTDTLKLELEDGIVKVNTYRIEKDWDSTIRLGIQNLNRNISAILSKNGGNLPAEIRIYILGNYIEIRFFAEQEPYNPSYQTEINMIYEGIPQTFYKLVIYKEYPNRKYPITTIEMYAKDSISLLNLINIDYSNYRKFAEQSKKKNDNRYYYNNFSIYQPKASMEPIFHADFSSWSSPWLAKNFIGPLVGLNSFGSAFAFDLGKVTYNEKRQPSKCHGGFLGFTTLVFLDGNKKWDKAVYVTAGYKFMNIRGENSIWLGNKFGIVVWPTEGKARIGGAYSVCFDNTRLIDYEITYYYFDKTASQVFLTAKFGF